MCFNFIDTLSQIAREQHQFTTYLSFTFESCASCTYNLLCDTFVCIENPRVFYLIYSTLGKMQYFATNYSMSYMDSRSNLVSRNLSFFFCSLVALRPVPRFSRSKKIQFVIPKHESIIKSDLLICWLHKLSNIINFENNCGILNA